MAIRQPFGYMIQYYAAEHEEELEREAGSIRSKARARMAKVGSSGSGLPYATKDWLDYLNGNKANFDEKLRTASKQRHSLAARIAPLAVDMPEVSRIRPVPPKLGTWAWLRKLRQEEFGWFCLSLPLQPKCVFFFCALIGHAKAVQLQPVRGAIHVFDLQTPLCESLIEVTDVVRGTFGTLDADFVVDRLFQLEMSQRVLLRVEGSEIVQLQARRAAGEEKDRDSAPETNHFSDAGSDASMVDSGLESGAEEALEEPDPDTDPDSEGDEAGAGDAEATLRWTSGTHSSHKSPYFTLANYSIVGKGDQCRISMLPRWQVPLPQGMGKHNCSKTVQILEFDSDKTEAPRTTILLRAWALHRFQQGGVLQHSEYRQRWFTAELHDLKTLVRALGRP